MKQLLIIALLASSLLAVAQETETQPPIPKNSVELPPFQIAENKELKQYFVRFLQDSTYTDWFLLVTPQWEKAVQYSLTETNDLGANITESGTEVKAPKYGEDEKKGGYFLQPYYKIGPQIQQAQDTVWLNRPLNDEERKYFTLQNQQRQQ